MESIYELGTVQALDLEQLVCMGPDDLAKDLEHKYVYLNPPEDTSIHGEELIVPTWEPE